MTDPPLLLIEDSPEDVEAMRRTLARLGFDGPLQVAADGDRALETLAALEAPPLGVVLDLNMPGVDGRDVLRWIRAHPTLSGVRVAVLSTSLSPQDVAYCMEHGADAYLVKPVGLAELRDKLSRMLALFRDGTPIPVPY